MIRIAHRGNINGPNPKDENNPEYIDTAIKNGFDAEIDVWSNNDRLYLGHDSGIYLISANYIISKKDKLWCHAKNLEALNSLMNLNVNCFFHNTDDGVLTSSGHIWTYPGKKLYIRSIAVMPESSPSFQVSHQISGICSDYPGFDHKSISNNKLTLSSRGQYYKPTNDKPH